MTKVEKDRQYYINKADSLTKLLEEERIRNEELSRQNDANLISRIETLGRRLSPKSPKHKSIKTPEEMLIKALKRCISKYDKLKCSSNLQPKP